MFDAITKWLGCNQDNNNACILVHLNIIIYALCYWIQQPTLGYLSKEVGATAIMYGSLETFVSLLALFGGSVVASINDTKGSRYSIILCQVGSFFMYFFMAFAYSFEILVMSRVPAILQHTMLCSQSAISLLSTADSRSLAIGRLSLSYGIGMVIGSPLGGYCAGWIGYRGAASVAAVITAVMVLVDLIYLPHFSNKKTDDNTNQTNGVMEQVRKFGKLFRSPRVLAILGVAFPLNVGLGAYRSMFSLFAKDEFDLESKDVGVYIGFAAVVGLMANVFLVSPATRRLGNFFALVCSTGVILLCYATLWLVNDFTTLMIWTIPSTVGSTLFYTLGAALMSLAVTSDTMGMAISLSHASRSIGGIVSPLLGSVVLQYHGYVGLGHFVALMAFLSMSCALYTQSKYPGIWSEASSKSKES